MAILTLSPTQSDTQRITARSHDAVIRVYDAADNVIETHEHAGDFKEWVSAVGKTRSRHAVKHDGSLLRSVDRGVWR